jgi:hypothetical protein
LVTFEFEVEDEVRVGEDRTFAQWSAQSSVSDASPVWAGVAIEGLPSSCQLEVRRWEDVQATIEAGSPPDELRYNIGMEDGPLTSAMRSPVGAGCVGEYRLHVAVVGDGQSTVESRAIVIV